MMSNRLGRAVPMPPSNVIEGLRAILERAHPLERSQLELILENTLRLLEAYSKPESPEEQIAH